jgi:hypothetical protein
MSEQPISPDEYERVCNKLQRLRFTGEATENTCNTGTHEPGKEPASSPEIIPPPSISFVPFTLTTEAKSNRWETARLAELRKLGVPSLRCKAITLLLGFDCRYTPDISYVDENGRYVFEEVKGFRRDDAMAKLRVAARMFPEFRFVLAELKKKVWVLTTVKP